MSKIFGFSVGAVALFPFIIVRDQTILDNKFYINHESIHIRQYIDTLIIGLFVIALIEYMYAIFFLNKSKLHAYYYMSHEQEAHQNDHNLEYLNTRPLFASFKYINPKNKKLMDLVNGERVIY